MTAGPFARTGDLLAGFWLVQVKSTQAAIDLFNSAPFEHGAIELRQVFESEDFAPAIKTSEGRATLQAEDDFRERSKR